jgi:holo-[acyl-carrier protein] synthase
MDIGVGIDIESPRRFAQAQRKLFTDTEWSHAAGRPDSLAGIWCAKEAVVKAIGKWRTISLRDVELTWDAAGRPCAQIAGFSIDLTISHTQDAAVAVALATPTPSP